MFIVSLTYLDTVYRFEWSMTTQQEMASRPSLHSMFCFALCWESLKQGPVPKDENAETIAAEPPDGAEPRRIRIHHLLHFCHRHRRILHVHMAKHTHVPTGMYVCMYVGRYCIVLSCLVLSCIVLYCLVLSCIVLYCLVLYCLVLSCLVLSCIVLSCLVLSCLVLYCIVLYCLVLYCLVLSCLVLYCLVLSCLVLYCLVLSCIVLSCLVLSCIVCMYVCVYVYTHTYKYLCVWYNVISSRA